MFELEELIKELYTKYPEMSKTEIELICRTQFRFVWDNIQSGEFKTINLKHVGKFVPKPKLKEFWVNKLRDEGNPGYNKQFRNKGNQENKAGDNQESIQLGEYVPRGDSGQEGCSNETNVPG